MKKLFSYILLLAMCLSLFAGCANEEAPDLTGLEKAKTYLFNLYKDSGETTVSSFDVVGVVVVQGYGTYNVEWTADNSAITATPNDKMVTINIPASPEEEIVYKLTAKISDGKGNSVSVEFNHKVPAGGNLADGTYVVLSGNLTMSSLAQDKNYGYPTANEVTVADGQVSNHFKADVLTFTKIGDAYTIQDAYGRYFYLKGTYNSFNVDATMPTEGHLFTIGRDGENFTIINTATQKTLAYSAKYTSWGCYAEPTEEDQTALTILSATAPATDPSTGDSNDNNTNPVAPNVGVIETPVAGTAYKMALVQGSLGKTLYFTGLEKSGQPWYFQSTENASDAIDVFVEEVSGGLRLYFMANGTKTYLDMYKNDTHYSLRQTTEPTAVYTWNTEYKTLVANVEGVDCYIGTYNNYNTFSCNKLEKIASSFVANLYGAGGTAPETPATPDTDTPSTPSTGTPADGSKVVIYNPGDGKYATGTEYLYTSSKGSTKAELTLDTNKASALVLTVKVGSNGNISFVSNDGKYLFCDGTDVKLVSSAGENTEFVLEAATGGYYIRCANATYSGKPQYLEVYSGYLTCYSMGSNTAQYTFELQAA